MEVPPAALNASSPSNLVYQPGPLNAYDQLTEKLRGLPGTEVRKPSKRRKRRIKKRPLIYRTRLYLSYLQGLLQVEQRQMRQDIKTFDLFFQVLFQPCRCPDRIPGQICSPIRAG